MQVLRRPAGMWLDSRDTCLLNDCHLSPESSTTHQRFQVCGGKAMLTELGGVWERRSRAASQGFENRYFKGEMSLKKLGLELGL